jgi:hypothetical protein
VPKVKPECASGLARRLILGAETWEAENGKAWGMGMKEGGGYCLPCGANDDAIPAFADVGHRPHAMPSTIWEFTQEPARSTVRESPDANGPSRKRPFATGGIGSACDLRSLLALPHGRKSSCRPISVVQPLN